ncbi:hypothetical protein BH23BAC1_BH23BAC1_44310 [soil metagenome]
MDFIQKIMKNAIISILTIFLLIISDSESKAQKIENFKYKIVDGKVQITYDLITVKEGQEVEVRLYSTLKGFDMRLYRATGDIGKELKAGKDKKIQWNNNEELTSYNKVDMTFKLELIAKQMPAKNIERAKSKGLFAGFFGSEK